MKKKYLLMALLGALTITGCNNDDTSSTSSSTNNNSTTSSSTSKDVIPTVAEGVSKIEDNFTVSYTIAGDESGYE